MAYVRNGKSSLISLLFRIISYNKFFFLKCILQQIEYIVYMQNIRLSMITLPKTKVAHNILKNRSFLLLIYGNILIYNILIYSNIV